MSEQASGSHTLSPREVEVLRLKCSGLADKQIATVLDLSTRTVHIHLRNIYRKTGCKHASLGIWAVRNGLVTVGKGE